MEETIEGAGGQFDPLVDTVLVVLGFLMLAHVPRRGPSAEGEYRAMAPWMEKEVTN